MMLRSVIAAALLTVVGGCSLFGPSRDELHDGARSLLPPGSSIVDEVEGDCVELARSPSCVHIYFLARQGPLAARTRAIEDAARASGWHRTRREDLPGGNELRYRRGRLQAIIVLRSHQRAAPCREKPRRSCADLVMVEKAN